MIGQSLAVCAGLCAAAASTCAKLAMAADSSHGLCLSVLQQTLSSQKDVCSQLCHSVLFYLRCIFFGLIFFFNALMWTLFVKSLQKCTSSVEASVTNTGANIFFTALIGWMFFGETLSLMWWCGATLIVIGLIFIHRGSSEQTQKVKES